MVDRQTAKNEAANQRYSNLIYDSEVFLNKLREFKPQSLGSLEARRKSSSTLIFPNPLQACMGPSKCPRYPHGIKQTSGYWTECHGPGLAMVTKGSSSYHQGQSNEPTGGIGFYPRSIESDFPNEQRQTSAGLHSSASQEGFVNLPSRLSNEYLYEPSDHVNAHAKPDILSTFGPRRQQSLDSLNSDIHYERRFQHQISDRFDKRDPSNDHRIASPDAADSNNQARYMTYTAKSSTKKRSIKRMMTRDDIDLHKPRRGTPNITITEPSFNQSTILFGLGGNQRASSALSKQVSEGPGSSAQPTTNNDQTSNRDSFRRLRKLKQQNFDGHQSSFDGQNMTGDSFDNSKPLELASSDDDTKGSLGSVEFTETDSILNRPQSASSSRYTHHHHHHHNINAFHRPSVIHEDGNETTTQQQSTTITTNPSIGGAPSTNDSPNKFDNVDEYCGLSTSTYNKKPYSHMSRQEQQEALDHFRGGPLELISFEEENYEKFYYGCEHWNYFTNDELLGPVMLSLKQEVNNQRDHFHVLLRTVSYTLHGTIPASTICADRYDREAIVHELSNLAKLKPPLMLGQLPTTPDELLKLDRIFIKTELKVGVIYIKEGQAESEEAILGNREESPLFTEFLDLLGDRITLKGFDKYKGGLDTVHNLTGTESVYTQWRNIEIMFHVSTMLPHEENDPQKLQKKRHIGNDIVCVAFIESDDMLFWPGCIKSYFLHTFITVRTSPKPLGEGEKRKYYVSCVCRNEVQYAFKPYLVEKDEFFKSDCFREWLLVKIVNGERASYSAPKFARMQDRTRSQLLEDIITNLANHFVTGQIPKPYRRGSWRPLGHTRASSPLEDSMKDYFEDYDQLAKDFANAFCGPSKSVLSDVVFKVKDKDDTFKLVHGVRAIMAIRSRTFLEMLYGFAPPGTGASGLQHQSSLRAIEMKALSGDPNPESGQTSSSSKNILTKRGSFGADSSRKIEERERRQSMLPNLTKSISQKPNYLTVPSTSGVSGGVSASSGTGGLIKNAFNRLVSGNWSGWSGNVKSYKGEPMLIRVDQNRKLNPDGYAICKEIAKFDSDKLSQREFEIKEFDYETFQQTIEYIHNGQCKLSYETIPGLICAAEHYDLHDLLHACFHHANTHMRLNAAPKMMNALYQNSCFYVTAMQLLESIYVYIDPLANEFFSRSEYLDLDESVFTALISRKTIQVSELKKFQAMQGWVKHQIAKKQASKLHDTLTKQQIIQPESPTSITGTQYSVGDQQEPSISTLDQQHEIIASKTFSKKGDTETSLDEEPQKSSSIPSSPIQSIDKSDAIEFRQLMSRLVKTVNIKLDRISSEDIVKYILPTRVFSHEKIFENMADESRFDY